MAEKIVFPTTPAMYCISSKYYAWMFHHFEVWANNLIIQEQQITKFLSMKTLSFEKKAMSSAALLF